MLRGTSRQQAMDVDPPDFPTLSGGSSSSLKRSSSAPMIDQISDTGTCSPNFSIDRVRSQRAPLASAASLSPLPGGWRPRRLSANHGSISSPSSPHGLAPRVQQLKKEEGLDEARHESALHSTIKLSESWGDLTVGEETRHLRVSDPLTVNLGPWSCPMSPGSVNTSTSSHQSSLCGQPGGIFQHSCPLPSPTRGARVNAQFVMRSVSFSPSPSPSPTRKTFTTRRSQSPIAMRANQQLAGAVKRKCDLAADDSLPLPKRLFGSGAGLLMPQVEAACPVFGTPASTSSSPDGPKAASLSKAMEQVTVTSVKMTPGE